MVTQLPYWNSVNDKKVETWPLALALPIITR
uniref:Uncharacterized protein n=1 Tax=Rhizophora mucronata TaxID=61149 RepID=A0A2P2R2D7_RHIMU